MKTKIFNMMSFTANMDFDKLKVKLADLGDVENSASDIYLLGFDSVVVKNIYNNKVILDDLNKEAHLDVESIIVSCGYVLTIYTFDFNMFTSDELKIDIIPSYKMTFQDSDYKSLSDISNIILEKIADFPKMMEGMANIDDDAPLYSRIRSSEMALESYSCLKIFRPSVTYGIDWEMGNKVESLPKENVELIIQNKDLSAVEDNNHEYIFYKGDSQEYTLLVLELSLIKKKLRECITLYEGVLEAINETAKKILSRIESNNPVYWQDLSVDIEVMQLKFIGVQQYVSSILSHTAKNNLGERLFEKYNKSYQDTINSYYELIHSLGTKIDSGLLNIGTPIKSRNDFKLRESTDKVNDRILFLSFIAMCIPLISYIASDTLSQTTKTISGIIIITLPAIYYISNKLYKRRLLKTNQKENLKDKIKSYERMIKDIGRQKEIIKDVVGDSKNDINKPILEILSQQYDIITVKIDKLKNKLNG